MHSSISALLGPLLVLTANQANALPQSVRVPDDTFVSFSNFLDRVTRTTFADYKDTAVRDEAAFLEFKSHIQTMYGGVSKPDQVASFYHEGDHVDCLLLREQPTVHLLGIGDISEAPSEALEDGSTGGQAPGDSTNADSPLRLGQRDRFGNAISCPTGTIPMSRLSLEKVTRFPTLDALFTKPPSPNPEGESGSPHSLTEPGVKHLHAYGDQTVTSFGGNSWLNLWNPTGSFTLSQQWYLGKHGLDPIQTLEGGWYQSQTRHPGSNKGRLFIFYTADNYEKFKCWNLECGAFVQTNNNWVLDGTFTQYSAIGGTQVGFELQWKMYGTNWWLLLRGASSWEPVGYYPVKVYNGGQLSKNANLIQFGGEVANYTGGNTFAQMGSSKFAVEGFKKAAYQRTIFNIPRNENGGAGNWANLVAHDTAKTTCYTIDLFNNAANSGNWGTHFYFGGPGGNNCPK